VRVERAAGAAAWQVNHRVSNAVSGQTSSNAVVSSGPQTQRRVTSNRTGTKRGGVVQQRMAIPQRLQALLSNPVAQTRHPRYNRTEWSMRALCESCNAAERITGITFACLVLHKVKAVKQALYGVEGKVVVLYARQPTLRCSGKSKPCKGWQRAGSGVQWCCRRGVAVCAAGSGGCGWGRWVVQKVLGVVEGTMGARAAVGAWCGVQYGRVGQAQAGGKGSRCRPQGVQVRWWCAK